MIRAQCLIRAQCHHAGTPLPHNSSVTRLARAVSMLGRIVLLAVVVSLGSCRFLVDEFTRLDRAGPIAEPQEQAPSATVDRS